MPDFAKRHRETMERQATYAVPVRIMPWSQFELSNGIPVNMPTPHCVGCLMVFDDEAAAHAWADGCQVLHLLTTKAAGGEEK